MHRIIFYTELLYDYLILYMLSKQLNLIGTVLDLSVIIKVGI